MSILALIISLISAAALPFANMIYLNKIQNLMDVFMHVEIASLVFAFADLAIYIVIPSIIIGLAFQSHLVPGIISTVTVLGGMIYTGGNITLVLVACTLSVINYLVFIRPDEVEWDDDPYDFCCIIFPILGILRLLDYKKPEKIEDIILKIIAIAVAVITLILATQSILAYFNIFEYTMEELNTLTVSEWFNQFMVVVILLPFLSVTLMSAAFTENNIKVINFILMLIFTLFNSYRTFWLFIDTPSGYSELELFMFTMTLLNVYAFYSVGMESEDNIKSIMGDLTASKYGLRIINALTSFTIILTLNILIYPIFSWILDGFATSIVRIILAIGLLAGMRLFDVKADKGFTDIWGRSHSSYDLAKSANRQIRKNQNN